MSVIHSIWKGHTNKSQCVWWGSLLFPELKLGAIIFLFTLFVAVYWELFYHERYRHRIVLMVRNYMRSLTKGKRGTEYDAVMKQEMLPQLAHEVQAEDSSKQNLLGIVVDIKHLWKFLYKVWSLCLTLFWSFYLWQRYWWRKHSHAVRFLEN